MPPDDFEHRPTTTRSPREACFALLGLPASATAAEVTRAYRKLAVTHHPDHRGDADAFHELERAYRECMRQMQPRPRISGQPGRDSFRVASPQMPRRSAMVCFGLTVLVIYALAAWFDTRLAILGLVILGPISLGGLVSQLRPGWSLLVSGVTIAAIGIAWAVAVHQIGWISYAFTTVRVSFTDYVAAVPAAKRWGLVAAIAMTVLSILMVVMGCTAAVMREKR